MASILQNGIKTVFGLSECPPLPDGYTLTRRHAASALAVDKNGKEFLIFLNPNRLAPILEHQKNGQRVDLENAISF